MNIVPLQPKNYNGEILHFCYTTTHYYDIERNPNAFFDVKLVRKPFEFPQQKSFTAALFADYIESPRVFVLRDAAEVIGYLEIGSESWHNRLRISALLVHEAHRGKGGGSMLLEYAKQYALDKGYREVVLETQSCNDPAICAYLKHDFKVMGIDLTHYSNDDLKNREVRLEMMYTVDSNQQG